jgi:hypothetical protein
MKAKVSRRLEKLEHESATFGIQRDADWGTMAEVRHELLHAAQVHAGKAACTQLSDELDQLGPMGLYCEILSNVLAEQGIVRTSFESLAETLARGLGTTTDELKLIIDDGRFGDEMTRLVNQGSPNAGDHLNCSQRTGQQVQ